MIVLSVPSPTNYCPANSTSFGVVDDPLLSDNILLTLVHRDAPFLFFQNFRSVLSGRIHLDKFGLTIASQTPCREGSMKIRLVLAIVLSTVLWTATSASADDSFADIAGKTGCGILASLLKNPQAKVAAGGACVYGTSIAKSAVGNLIDKYFDKKDQDFANEYCLTIVRADGTKIEPNDKTSCSN